EIKFRFAIHNWPCPLTLYATAMVKEELWIVQGGGKATDSKPWLMPNRHQTPGYQYRHLPADSRYGQKYRDTHGFSAVSAYISAAISDHPRPAKISDIHRSLPGDD